MGELESAVRLDGKVAVIIGAASGLAQETARLFALAGARLVLADIDAQGLAKTSEQVISAGGTASLLTVDASDRDAVEALADKALAECGQVDVWINSAGYSYVHPMLQTDTARAERTVAVNIFGPYWGCVAAARIMAPRGKGSIINVSSAGGAIPLPGLAFYGLTKAAVNSMTRTAAAELGPMGLRVNAVAPGFVETTMSADLFRDEQGNIVPERREAVMRQMAASSPLGRIGERSDIAHALLYLASDASSFVTGQVLTVNGGSSM